MRRTISRSIARELSGAELDLVSGAGTPPGDTYSSGTADDCPADTGPIDSDILKELDEATVS